ncbi:MAG: RimK family alpha-L-glutamate ligase, partial [Novipirellula sp. JB048]
MSGKRILVLGCGRGWHAKQLQAAANARGCTLQFSDYESLFAAIGPQSPSSPDGVQLGVDRFTPESSPSARFDAVLARSMPAGSLEKITFRLAVLHAWAGDTVANATPIPVINSPRAMEIAIDKFATLALLRRLGYLVPETIVVQSRSEAMAAFEHLGGDCVVKPIFGGEGRGV